MIPQDIAQSKLIYFLSLRGYFAESLWNKIVKGLKLSHRYLKKGCDYHTQSICKIFPVNTHDSYCYNLECRHSFYPLAPLARLGVNAFQQFCGRERFEEFFLETRQGLILGSYLTYYLHAD